MAGGGVWRARSCAPRTRGGVHFCFAIGWPREAHVTCSLCGAGAAHVWMWAKRGLKIVLPPALWLLFCGSGGDRDMYVQARRCMFAVALWDRRDVVARGRNSPRRVCRLPSAVWRVRVCIHLRYKASKWVLGWQSSRLAVIKMPPNALVLSWSQRARAFHSQTSFVRGDGVQAH